MRGTGALSWNVHVPRERARVIIRVQSRPCHDYIMRKKTPADATLCNIRTGPKPVPIKCFELNMKVVMTGMEALVPLTNMRLRNVSCLLR